MDQGGGRIRKVALFQAQDYDHSGPEPEQNRKPVNHGIRLPKSILKNSKVEMHFDTVQELQYTQMKSGAEEWALMTGWHGVVDFVYAQNFFLKVMWLAIVVIGGYLAIHQSYALIRDYTDEDPWITTSTYTDPDDGAVDWPNMTISVLNWLNDDSLKKVGLTDPGAVAYVVNGKKEATEFYYKFNKLGIDTSYKNFEDYWQKKSATQLSEVAFNKSSDEILARLGQTCNETVVHCGHGDQFDLHSTIDCCANSSRLPELNPGAFTLDPTSLFGGRTASDKSGYGGSIYFLLDPKSNADYEIIRQSQKPSIGLQVHLYYGDKPDSLTESVFVTVGTHTVVSLVAEWYKIEKSHTSLAFNWNVRKQSCMMWDEFHFQYLDTKNYTVSFCQKECKARYLHDHFGCTCQSVALKNGLACSNYTIKEGCLKKLDCLDRAQTWPKELTKNGMNFSQCMNNCRDPCEYQTVVPNTITRTKFPAKLKVASFTKYLNKALQSKGANYNGSDVEMMTLLEVYFEMNQWVVMEKILRLTTDDLIGNIGGALGVWTGISLISVIQAMIYVIFGLRALINVAVEFCFRNEPVFIRPGTLLHHRRVWRR